MGFRKAEDQYHQYHQYHQCVHLKLVLYYIHTNTCSNNCQAQELSSLGKQCIYHSTVTKSSDKCKLSIS